MPIYEYLCANCQHCFERIQKIQEAPITLCPQCQQHSAQKQVSAAGFQLKGSGWYVTDFKKGGTASDTSKNASGESKAAPTSAE